MDGVAEQDVVGSLGAAGVEQLQVGGPVEGRRAASECTGADHEVDLVDEPLGE